MFVFQQRFGGNGILDIGPETVAQYKEILASAKTVAWNGPMGVFEFERFAVGTNQLAQLLADQTDSGTQVMIGGGDSVAAINKYGLKDKVSYVSTGGGAMLEYIEGKVLPGIKAIRG